jgi:hypothetical protein
MNRSALIAALFAGSALSPLTAHAQVVINEFQYDDVGTDDREFIELYNAGTAAVDIGSWALAGYDQGATANPTTTIPAGTMIEPGSYFVIGNTGVLNVSHVVPANFLENDQEVLTLRDSAGVLIDAVAWETNKSLGFVTTSAGAPADASTAVAPQLGPGLFGNHQGGEIAGTPLNATVSWGRYVDGRDTNNNGRDFGLRPGTPGTTNAPGGPITTLVLTDPTPLAPGTVNPGLAGTFVAARVMDPSVIDTNNPNVIAAPNGTGTKAWTVWDPSGGGDGATSTAVFATKAASFTIRAYLETTDNPVQFNATNVQFRGAEITLYGLGGGDALTNLTDLDGSIGISAGTLPVSDTANGFTGICWVYERVAADPTTLVVSEKLHLVDANDGGDSDLGGNTPLDWTILATYDLSGTASGWHTLSIAIDAAGSGIAAFDNQTTAFTTPDMHSSAFNVGYRENLQQGAELTPEAMMRPPTFTFVPAPGAIGELSFAAPTAGAINLTISATAGQTIGLEYSQTLVAGSWTDLGNFDINPPLGSFSDTDPVRVARPRGFYRAFLR